MTRRPSVYAPSSPANDDRRNSQKNGEDTDGDADLAVAG